jgi:predicted nucleotidyltransferase
MLLNNLENIIANWASSKTSMIKEVFVFGSQAKKTTNNRKATRSDFDILIFLNMNKAPDSIYSELSMIGLQNGVLIHPLIITENEKDFKLNIFQYRRIFEKGKLIFKAPTNENAR